MRSLARRQLAAELHTELSAVGGEIADLEKLWPAGVALRVLPEPGYNDLPYLLLPAFPRLGPVDIRPLARFCALLAGSLLVHDPLIDGHATTDIATATARIMAMQLEAYLSLHESIPAGSPFWASLRGHLADYLGASLEEQRFARGDASWEHYDERVARRLATGKHAASKSVVAGLAALSGESALLAPLEEALDAFNIAVQMWDDVTDWKVDLKRAMPSLLLCRALGARPTPADAGEIDRVARSIYYGGHARHVLSLALDSLDRAASVREVCPDMPFLGLVAAMRGTMATTLGDIERIVSTNVQRARSGSSVTIATPQAAGPHQEAALAALRYLLRQRRLGFGELRDLMTYHPAHGFSLPEGTCYFGDVFQRALLVDALCHVPSALQEQLRPVIEAETDYLIERRSTAGAGGWAYYFNLPELPADADDLAAVMLALVLAGRRDDVTRYCEPPLEILLRDNAHPDGSFETWIVPAAGRTAAEERHAELIPPIWGAGPDDDVIPSVLYAIRSHDRTRHAETVDRGVRYLEGRQRADGTWKSRWYKGPYYAIHVVLRLLAEEEPGSPAVARALDFLRWTQREDGGFGLDGMPSDALNTALGLLGLSAARRAPGEPGDEGRIARCLDWLTNDAGPDGSWPQQELIYKGFGSYYGSKTMTTIFVLQAVLRCVWGAEGEPRRAAP